jgi:hypothetical protein
MKTMGEMLNEMAKESGANLGELIDLRFNEHLGTLSERYKRLATKVLLRLPENWDNHANWEMREGRQNDIVQGGLCFDKYQAGAQMFENDDDDSSQTWEIILVTDALDGLSDEAVCGVIVHELGHVASGIPSDYGVRHEEVSEDRANTIAEWWGFERELTTLRHEEELAR